MLNFDLIPVQASTFAEKVDPLYYLLTIMSVISTVLIFAILGYLAYRYRYIEGENRLSKPFESFALEITWTIVPGIIFIAFFVWGAQLYFDYLKVPPGALEVDVIAKQWMWKVQHSNGLREVNELHVPVGQPVVLTMSSQDVLHDFYVPAFRVKADVIPGRFTTLWFEATKTGAYHLFCAEYCGTEHSLMGGTVYVMEPEKYMEWLAGGPQRSPRDAGEFLFAQRGCVTCHSGDAESRGPDLANVFGSQVELKNGDIVEANEAYIMESIQDPTAKIVEGYTALMPSFKGQLTPDDILDLLAYIKSLSEATE